MLICVACGNGRPVVMIASTTGKENQYVSREFEDAEKRERVFVRAVGVSSECCAADHIEMGKGVIGAGCGVVDTVGRGTGCVGE